MSYVVWMSVWRVNIIGLVWIELCYSDESDKLVFLVDTVSVEIITGLLTSIRNIVGIPKTSVFCTTQEHFHS